MSIDFILCLISSEYTVQNVKHFQLGKIVFDHHDTRLSTVLLYGNFYTNNSIFKSNRRSDICKVIVTNFTHLIAVNDDIFVLSENNVVSMISFRFTGACLSIMVLKYNAREPGHVFHIGIFHWHGEGPMTLNCRMWRHQYIHSSYRKHGMVWPVGHIVYGGTNMTTKCQSDQPILGIGQDEHIITATWS